MTQSASPGPFNLHWIIGTVGAAVIAGVFTLWAARSDRDDGDDPGVTAQADSAPLSLRSPGGEAGAEDLRMLVARFLSDANQAEIDAYAYGDPAAAAGFYTGEALLGLERSIAELNAAGQVRMSTFHSEKSYFAEVRRMGEAEVEVDTCEFWSRDILDRGTGDLVRAEPAEMYPQTVHIRDWRIVRIEFHDGPAFC
ncbi:MAG TPA: hypothetical protein VFG78_00580 [Gemmatimonadota bacterium]|nr:hypothetical protein [Gemmatimonadota bacterium]